MKKSLRVTRNQDFQNIISNGKFVSTKSFVVYYSLNNIDYSRVGISVGKKIGNAVIRNKVKRQVRSMVDDIFDFSLKLDYIIIVRPKYHNQDYCANKKELLDLYCMVYNAIDKLKRSEVINEKTNQ